MNKDDEKTLIKLVGLVSHLRSRILVLEDVCIFLANGQGLDAAEVRKILKEETAKLDETLLLEVGDQDPRLAEIADVFGRLKEQREKPPE